MISVSCTAAVANPSLNKLLIADPYKAIILYDFAESGKMTALARTTCDRLCNDIAFLTQLMLVADKSGNLLALQPNLKAPNDLEKIRLDVRGGLNLGEEIWTFTSESRGVIYGTAKGTVGRVREIKEEEYNILAEVQKAITSCRLVDVLGTAQRNLKVLK